MSEQEELFKILGNLVDQWENLPNDVISSLKGDAPDFANAVLELVQFSEP